MRQTNRINEITGLTAIFPAILLKAQSGGKNRFQEKLLYRVTLPNKPVKWLERKGIDFC